MAWYKVYYPQEFYATYFTTKVANFDAETILKGKEAILARMDEITTKGINASAKEKDDYTILEVAYEMYARGYEFTPARLGKSDAVKFDVDDGKVLLPFVAIEGVGKLQPARLRRSMRQNRLTRSRRRSSAPNWTRQRQKDCADTVCSQDCRRPTS